MKINSWVPMFVVTGFLVVGTILVMFLPETLERSKSAEDLMDVEVNETSSENGRISKVQSSIKKTIAQGFRGLQDALSIFNSPLILGLSFTFLLQLVHPLSFELAFQLASERFNWALSDVCYLPSPTTQ